MRPAARAFVLISASCAWVACKAPSSSSSTAGPSSASAHADIPAPPPSVRAGSSPKPAPSAAPSTAAPSGSLCDRVAHDQRELLEAARRKAAVDHPEERVHDVRYAAGGGLYEASLRGVAWTDDSTAAASLRTRAYAEALRRARADKDERAVWVLERSAPSDAAFVTVSPSLFPVGACEPTAHGAWALEASEVSLAKKERDVSRARMPLTWSASVSLMHYDVEGNTWMTLALEPCCGAHFDGEQQRDPLKYFDYDGDGEPEVIVHTKWLSDGPADDRSTPVMTFKAGAIIPYAPARRLALYGSALDVDGDGRPDLRTHAGAQVAAAQTGNVCAGRDPAEGYAPAFLAHSLADGSFSTSDDVAKAFARTWCPAPPSTIRSVEDAGCARLWASAPDKLAAEKARVASSCVEANPKVCKTAPRPAGAPRAVLGCSVRLAAFGQTPPFTLP